MNIRLRRVIFAAILAIVLSGTSLATIVANGAFGV